MSKGGIVINLDNSYKMALNRIPIEGKCVLDLIYAVLHGVSIYVPDGRLARNTIRDLKKANLRMVFELANSQEVANLCYYAVYNSAFELRKKEKFVCFFPEKVMDKFQDEHLKTVSLESRQEIETRVLMADFEFHAVEHMPLKDYVMKRFYDKPDMRYCKEIDLLIGKVGSDKVHEIMLDNNYELKRKGENCDVFFKGPVMTVNVHKGTQFEKTWDNSSTCANKFFRYEMTKEDFYVLFMTEFALKFSQGRASLRYVVDCWVYLRSIEYNLNHNLLSVRFKELGIFTFVKTMEQVAQVWFGDFKAQEQAGSSGNTGKITSINMIANRFIDRREIKESDTINSAYNDYEKSLDIDVNLLENLTVYFLCHGTNRFTNNYILTKLALTDDKTKTKWLKKLKYLFFNGIMPFLNTRKIDGSEDVLKLFYESNRNEKD